MKRTFEIVCGVVVVAVLGSAASAMTIDWTRQLGTASDDYGKGVAVDGSGNVYVTGNTGGGIDGNTNAGSYDMFLTKYNTGGTKQWTRQLGSSSSDIGYGVSVDGSGNAYVTGETLGGLDGNTSAGSGDMFLTKYNTSGTKQWTKQLGTSSNDGGASVSVDGSGNSYVTGTTTGGLDGNTNAGFGDMFLTKYNTGGTKQWTRQLGSSGNDLGNGVSVDGSGNAYATGRTYGDLDGNTNAGSYDMFLTKYNTGGTKQWTRQLGTSDSDGGYGVSVDGSGNAYVTGSTQGDLDGNTNAGDFDIFLTKYNTSGAKQWTKQLGTSSGDYGWSVSVDSSGKAYVTGYTYGDLDGNTSAGEWDMFLTKYDTDGTKLWTKQLGTGSDDEGYGVSVDSSGNAYVTGTTSGGLNGNTNAGSSDMFLVKYEVPEPATMSLLALGGLAILRKRRKQ
ncbi:MAG: PEP-CTERM sorting domain-containing protein [bacterium]|nr:PEP-CTERM sorting domain-containing protein [bacterium]